MFEKHLWKSDILSKDAGHPHASSLKISLFRRCFSNILLVKTTTWFLHKWNIGRKRVNPIWLKKKQVLKILLWTQAIYIFLELLI